MNWLPNFPTLLRIFLLPPIMGLLATAGNAATYPVRLVAALTDLANDWAARGLN